MRRLLLAAGGAMLPLASALAQDRAEHEGMPQLNFANPLTTSQVVWMAILFVVFYLLLAKWALPPVGQVIENRSAAITGDLQAAHAAKTSADAAAMEVEASTRSAHAEAQAQVAAAVAKAKAEAAAQAAEQDAALDAKLAESEARIGAARDAALGALREVASDTASVVVARLTGTSLPPERQRIEEAVDAALAARHA